MRNVIDAIISLVENPILNLNDVIDSNKIVGKNRANNMGVALEEYIKLLFSNGDYSIFSYLGNQNNPPDMMIDGGDAIEVKKIASENFNAGIALNSSYPKTKLFADSAMISQACKDAEEWNVKDMLYTIGFVNEAKLRALTFVYGSDYAADKEVYERIKNTIKAGVESIPSIEFAETKELGHVNRVDPLGITYLRVRGMWGIKSPFYLFREHFTPNTNAKFTFMMAVNLEKYHSFTNYNKLEELAKTNESLTLTNIKIKNPNNPAKLIPAKLITFEIL